jgi:hypothetical protein
LLVTTRLPVTLLAEAGAKLTVRGNDLPAATVTVPDNPVKEKPAPLMAAWEMVTLPVPLFVSVTVCDALLPTKALPKLRPLVLAERRYVCEGTGDVPVPVTATEDVEVWPS